jgi:hypothetical protein
VTIGTHAPSQVPVEDRAPRAREIRLERADSRVGLPGLVGHRCFEPDRVEEIQLGGVELVLDGERLCLIRQCPSEDSIVGHLWASHCRAGAGIRGLQ